MASETLNTLKQAFRQAAKNAATFFEREPHTLRSATSENDFGMFRYLSRNITPEEAACALPYVANQNRLEMAQFLIEEKAATLSPSYARYALWEAVKFLCEDCNADIMAGYIDAIKMTTYFKHKNVEDYLKKRQGSSSIQPSKPHIKPN